jgi:hypothetical protein
VEIHVFPALYRAADTLSLAELLRTEGEASCYEHPSKKATAECMACGRFICALCEVHLGSQSFCPACIHNPKAQARPALDTQRTLYDSIALWLATVPMLLFYFVVITGPMAIALSIYGWRKPLSLIRRSRWRFVLAILIAALQLAGIAALVLALVFGGPKVRAQ